MRPAAVGLMLLLLTACSGPAIPTGSSSTVAMDTTAVSGGTDSEGIPSTTTRLVEFTDGSSGIGDSLYPELGNGGYDVEHYALDLAFDGEVLSGSAGLTITATQPLRSFRLELTGLNVTGVTIDGLSASYDLAEELTVYPSFPIDRGKTVTLDVKYHGTPRPIPNVAGRFPVGWHQSVDGWFALSEPAGADTWFPSNNHPLDKATLSLQITVPPGLEAVSSGSLLEVEATEQGTAYLWDSSEPIAPYLVALVIGAFDREESTSAGGVPIVNYFDDDVGEAERRLFARQGEMLDFFAGIFGPYPFDEYGAIVLETIEVPAALETQTRSTFGTQILVLGEAVVAHELSHQWVGDSVSVADWGDIWLNEGFATYSDWLWLEHTQGSAALERAVKEAYGRLSGPGPGSLSSTQDGLEQSSLGFPPPGSPPADDLFNLSVYLRGGLTLHALRLHLGDEPFFGVLKSWATEHRYGNATTDDFLDLVERSGSTRARSLIEDWLFAKDMPPIEELGLRPPG